MTAIRRAVAATAALALVAVALLPSPALAHGNLDQSLDGDPGCTAGNFPAGVTASGGQRQSFVPTGSTISSVAMCVSATSQSGFLTVRVFGPGADVVGSSSQALPGNQPEPVPVGSRQFVHIDFLQGISVTPGATYTLEIGGGLEVTWYGTPPDGSSPYDYCAASPNTSQVRDFAFRVYTPGSPGDPPPCEAVPPTNTPVPPPPTNTPQPQAQPTDEAAPTSTAVPAGVTPVATTTAADATPLTGTDAPATGGPSTGASAGTAGSPRTPTTRTGTTAGISNVPAAGTGASGNNHSEPATVLAIALASAAIGAMLTATGVTLRRSR